MAFQYAFFNGPMPTTAVLAPVTTGAATIKTQVQVALKTGLFGEVVEWGFSGDASAAATPGSVELIETGSVFATVTAFVAADIHKWNDNNAPDPTTAYFTVSTSTSGYTATAEGTITASRLLEAHVMPPTGFYSKQFPLGCRPRLTAGNSLRIRTKFATAVNILCYVVVEV